MRLLLIHQLIKQAKVKNFTGVKTVKKFLSRKEMQIALTKVAMEKDASAVNFLAGVMYNEDVKSALSVANHNFLEPVVLHVTPELKKNKYSSLFSFSN